MADSFDYIAKARLAKWGNQLASQNATPVVLIGIGHGSNSGQVVLCTLEEPDMPVDKLKEFLLFTLRELDKL